MKRMFASIFAVAAIVCLGGCTRDRDECDDQPCRRIDVRAVSNCCECVPAPAPIVAESPKKLPRVETMPKPLAAKEAPKVVRTSDAHASLPVQPRRKMRTGEIELD